MAVKRFIIGATLAAALLPGCFAFTSKHEGNRLRRDVDALDQRVVEKENLIDARVQRLDKTLDEATKLLARNSADIGAEVQALRDENAELRGVVMETKRELEDLRAQMKLVQEAFEARVAEVEARLAETEQKADVPKTPGEQWAAAKRAYDTGDLKTARIGFSRLVRGWPTDDLADDAFLYWGESYFKEGDYEKAIAAYQKIFDPESAYKDRDLAAQALYRAGQAAEELKWCTDARAYYGFLRQNYPKSSYARKAAQRDKVLKRNAKNPKLCKN